MVPIPFSSGRDINKMTVQDHNSTVQPTGSRDTVLIVGRQAAGKSTYITRLLMELDHHDSGKASRHKLSIEVQGSDQRALMRTLRTELECGRWPPATLEISELRFKVYTPQNQHLELAFLDYPGEIFSRTFSGGDTETSAHLDLLTAVKRARHVFVLVDPGQVRVPKDQTDDETKHLEREDNTYGLVMMVKYLRGTGGERVPVTIVLTKADERWSLITAEAIAVEGWTGTNWIERVGRSMFPALFREAGANVRAEIVAAVQARLDPHSRQWQPNLHLPPINLIGSFKRAINFDLLNQLQHHATQRIGDKEMLRRLLTFAEQCGLSPQNFPEVRLAQNRVSGSGVGNQWMPGAELWELLTDYRKLDPAPRIDDLLDKPLRSAPSRDR